MTHIICVGGVGQGGATVHMHMHTHTYIIWEAGKDGVGVLGMEDPNITHRIQHTLMFGAQHIAIEVSSVAGFLKAATSCM